MTDGRLGGMNNDPKQTEEMCDYCFMPIDESWYDWGYFVDEYGEFYFHSECFQEANGEAL
jgi:hypothetical protein